MKAILRISIATISLLAFNCNVFSGAWVQKKYEGYHQLSFTYLKYSKLLNGRDPIIHLNRSVSDFTLQFYNEYGLTNKLTGIAIIPYKILATGKQALNNGSNIYFKDTLASGKLNGFGNINLGLRYQLYSQSWVISSQFLYGAPLNTFVASIGLRTAYDAHLLTISLLAGKGWKNSYITSDAGFQYRTNGYAPNLISSAEYGFKPQEKIWLAAVLNFQIPLTKGNYIDKTALQTGLYVDNQTFIGWGLKVNYSFSERWGTNLSGYGSPYSKSGGSAPTITFGIFYKKKS